MVMLDKIRKYCSECHVRLEYLFFLLLIFVSIIKRGINMLSSLLLLGILGVYRYNNYLSYTIALLYLILLFIGRKPVHESHKSIEKFEDIGNLGLISKILNKSPTKTLSLSKKYEVREVNDLFKILNVLSATERKRLYAYVEMSKIYLFHPNLVLKLIEQGKTNIDDLDNSDKVLSDKEKYGLDYYIHKRKPSSQYYKILEHLELSKNLDSKLNGYSSRVAKDMFEIMILFDFYNLLDTETRHDLSKNAQDVESGVDLWLYKTLNKIIIKNWQDDVFLKYDIVSRAKEAADIIKNKKKIIVKSTDVDVDYSKVDAEFNLDKQYEDYIKKYRKELYENEYKSIEVLNTLANKDDKDSEFLTDLVSKLGINFSNTILQILEEFVSLFSEKFQDSAKKEGIFDNLWEKYIYYFKEIIKIITAQGRLFYVGILIFLISILMYFAGMTK